VVVVVVVEPEVVEEAECGELVVAVVVVAEADG
jgi:hypothetical protein